MYGPLTTPEGRMVYLPAHLACHLMEYRPVEVAVSMPPVQVAPVSFPEFVEQVQEPLMSYEETETYEISCETVEIITVQETFEAASSDVTEVIAPPVVTVQEVEAVKEVETVEKRQLDDWEDSDSDAATDSVQNSEAVETECVEKQWLQADDKNRASVSQDIDDSGSVASTMTCRSQVFEDDRTVTRDLPVYLTKVAMRVREDCTSYAQAIGRIEKDTRVYVLENGIEKFPTSRLCHWWRQTFEGMNWVIRNIQQYEIDGRELADFAYDTQNKLDLNMEETELVKKALALVSRKSQVVYEHDGQMCRGWVSRIKNRKAQMSRLFCNSKPTIVVSRLRNSGRSLKEAEDKMEYTFEKLGLDFQNIKFATFFRKNHNGRDSIRERGRRIFGNWQPRNHCMIEFKTHRDANRALNMLTRFSSYPLDFEHSEGYSLYTNAVNVDYAKEYGNKRAVTYPKF